jgi:hypothetical protein
MEISGAPTQRLQNETEKQDHIKLEKKDHIGL